MSHLDLRAIKKMEVTKMDGLSSEPEVQKPEQPAEEKPTKDTKGGAKPKRPRVARKKPEKTLPSAADDGPAAAAPVDAVFFGKIGPTLRDLKREARAHKISHFVVAYALILLWL